MSFIDNLKNKMTGSEYDDYDDSDLDQDLSETINSAAQQGKVANNNPNGGQSFILVKPEKFDDSISIANHILAGKTVVLNLETTGKELSRRIIDILSGTAYAVGAQIKNVSNGTYLIIPGGSDFSGGNSATVDTSSFDF